MNRKALKKATKPFLFVFVFTLYGFMLNARTIEPTTRDSIVFNKIEHDYGTIERGSDGVCTFTFTNKGNRPLVLSNVRASCGCTVPKWPREPIAPGEEGEINIRYNTNITGAFNKTITVNSNAVNSTVRLRVKGQVVKN